MADCDCERPGGPRPSSYSLRERYEVTDGDYEVDEVEADEDVSEFPPDVQVLDERDDEFEEDAPIADEFLRYFGADFDVDGLVRRLKNRDITVPTFDPRPEDQTEYAGFQRKLVWTKKQKDRFIESILLGYPVPGIFLVERSGRKYLVLDGQQRLRTLQEYKAGAYGEPGKERVFRLTYVGPHFHGQRYDDLTPANQRVLDNTFIQATVVVPKSPDARSSVYQLFERINSGGTNLQPQEIRVALYAGPRIDAIRLLNYEPAWRALFGRPHTRLKDNELILRYMALRPVAEGLSENGWNRDVLRSAARASGGDVRAYTSPMSGFLNAYLDAYASVDGASSPESRAFSLTCQALVAANPEVLHLDGSTQVNAAHTDALLVGLSLAPSISERGVMPDISSVREAVEELLADGSYQSAVRESTSHANSVYSRLELSTKAFESL